jgi:glycerate 2-kinase
MSRGTGSDAAGRDVRARVLVCPDKFRGSLTAVQAAEALADGLQAGGVHRPWILPVADGGEGTVDCCLAAGFTEFPRRVTGADGHPVLARIAIRGPVAVIESAQACGLGKGPPDDRAALAATSFGVGELIRAALDAGCRRLIVGVGGTASTDGGAGLLQALGARLSDSRGNPVAAGGGGLATLEQADLSELDPRLAACDLLAATDVDNPLLGTRGAAAVFAPQKGADRQAQAQLERGLVKLAGLLDRSAVPHLSGLPGTGAGGGIAYALLRAGAQRVSGADTILEMLRFTDHASAADLVVTGEGSLDASSLGGKAPVTLAMTAHRLGTLVVAVAGRSTLTPQQQREAGIDRVYQLLDLAGSAERSMREAPLLLRRAGTDIAAWLAGHPRRPLRAVCGDP